MASITSVGTGSNLDLEGLITKIITNERTAPENRLNLKQTTLEATVSALGNIKSALSDFQTSLAKLKSASFFTARSAVASDTSLISATASPGTDPGAYTIEVLAMAKAHKVASANFATAATPVGSGTLNIGVGSSTFDVAITAGTNDTLAGIRDAINSAPGNNGSVRASILTVSDGLGGTASKLVLNSSTSGVSHAISVAVTGDADGIDNDNAGLSKLISANLSQINPAQDAEITIDGFPATSSTNQFSDAIPGVTINVLKQGPDPLNPLSSSVTVAVDKSGVKTAIEGFVANYNALATILNAVTNYDPATQTRGLMSGDAGVSAMESRVRRLMADTASNTTPGALNTLADIGISTNLNGLISLNDAQLSNALNNKFDDFAALFTGTNGIASRLDTLTTQLTGSGGTFSARATSLQEQLAKVQVQKDALNTRLTALESRYRKQFSALDSLVNQLNSTGSFLTQQLDATAKIISGKN
jgi:flagellar hook-associated protein 2